MHRELTPHKITPIPGEHKAVNKDAFSVRIAHYKCACYASVRPQMDIFTEIKPTTEVIESLYKDGKPVEIIGEWESVNLEELELKHYVVLSENDSEFQFELEFQHGADATEHEKWLMHSAKILSVKLSCKVIYPGNIIDPDNPWLSTVFDCGKAYLADTSNSKLENDGKEKVKIMRALPELDVTHGEEM